MRNEATTFALVIAQGVINRESMWLLGSPPFGLFLSELTILRAGFGAANPLLPALLLAFLLIAFIAFARTATGMALGAAPDGTGEPVRPYATAEQRLLAAAPLVLGMAALLVLGLWIPAGLDTTILTSIGAVT